MTHDAPHRQPRQDEVAELAPALFSRNVHAGREKGFIAAKGLLQLFDLVFARASRHLRKITRDFLQAKHVRVGEAPGLARDALGIDPLIDAAAPLNVPAQYSHRRDNSSTATVAAPPAAYRKGPSQVCGDQA